jgi:hypothetical protein
MNLKGRIKNIVVRPLPGDELGALKKACAEMAKILETKVEFNHNGRDFVADKEGNVAQIN